jgi:putative aldouronate transport system permease protein
MVTETAAKNRRFSFANLRSKNNTYYYLMLVLPMLYYIIFHLVPMGGLVLAFRKFVPGGSMFGSEWVGIKYFKMFLKHDLFWRAFYNNLILSGLTLCTVPIPAIFALFLNEIINMKFKRFVQTVSYLPRFMSIVVVVGIVQEILSPNTGIVNNMIAKMGMERIYFLIEPGWFRPIFILSHIWQWTGFGAIIYLAAISNIDPTLYESAVVDGANKFKQILHITIPGILPVFTIMFILNVGRVLNVNFEKVLLLETPLTYETAEVIQTFVFRIGIQNGSISMATAVGFSESILAVILMVSANTISKKLGQSSLF